MFDHDDVIKWKQFWRYWPLVRGIHWSQWPVTRSFDVLFDLRLNKGLSKQSWSWWFETPLCPLWRHGNVYFTACVEGKWGPGCGNTCGCSANTLTCDPAQGCVNCKPGWRGDYNCKENIDECQETPDICGDKADCMDTQGSYECTCHAGYAKNGNGNCVGKTVMNNKGDKWTPLSTPFHKLRPGWSVSHFEKQRTTFSSTSYIFKLHHVALCECNYLCINYLLSVSYRWVLYHVALCEYNSVRKMSLSRGMDE